jgi:hypothetical protein
MEISSKRKHHLLNPTRFHIYCRKQATFPVFLSWLFNDGVDIQSIQRRMMGKLTKVEQMAECNMRARKHISPAHTSLSWAHVATVPLAHKIKGNYIEIRMKNKCIKHLQIPRFCRLILRYMYIICCVSKTYAQKVTQKQHDTMIHVL